MIVGYYPGAGGNRYYEYANGRKFNKPGIGYDSTTINIVSRSQYFNNNILPNFLETGNILCHCVNYHQIKKAYPNRDDIIIIQADLKSSLRREWSIQGKYKPMFFPVDNNASLLETYNIIRADHWPIINHACEIDNLPLTITRELERKHSLLSVYTDPLSVYNYLVAAYESIIWHNELYNQYPFDAGNYTL